MYSRANESHGSRQLVTKTDLQGRDCPKWNRMEPNQGQSINLHMIAYLVTAWGSCIKKVPTHLAIISNEFQMSL